MTENEKDLSYITCVICDKVISNDEDSFKLVSENKPTIDVHLKCLSPEDLNTILTEGIVGSN